VDANPERDPVRRHFAQEPAAKYAFNLPAPDPIQEFKVMTSNFSAEYRRFGGGLFIAETRSGANQFHASLWEYLRNKVLNARNFFSLDKPNLKQNQFGFHRGRPRDPQPHLRLRLLPGHAHPAIAVVQHGRTALGPGARG
jgi:hypothetical protein